MTEGFLDNPELPAKAFGVPTEAIPDHIRSVYGLLEKAAKSAAGLYTTQKELLNPLLDDLNSYIKEDRRAKDLYTVPDSQGRWVYMHQHPAFEDALDNAREDLRQAAKILETTRPGDASYLYLVRRSLDKLDKEGQQEVLRSFTRQRSEMSFMLGLIEGEKRKRWWEGYLGFADEGRTSQMQEEADRYMRLGAKRSGDRFTEFAKEVMMRFEYAGLMAGRLGSRRVSAKNLRADGDDHVRISIYSGPFYSRYKELLEIAGHYTAANLLPDYDGVVRFLSAHEFSHIEDDPGEGKAGELTQPIRESSANFSAIDFMANDFEEGNISEQELSDGIRGALAYSLADCDYLLKSGEPLPDLMKLTRHTVYDPGSSLLLYRWLSSSGLVVENGKIVAINLDRVINESRELYVEEGSLNFNGNLNNVYKHFNSQLPIDRPFNLYSSPSEDKIKSISA